MLAHCAYDGDKKARFTGESAKEAVKTIRVRECRVISAVTVVTMLVCFFHFAREAAGAAAHPAFPTPFGFGRRISIKARAEFAPRDREATSGNDTV
jgi:hypothetical protein